MGSEFGTAIARRMLVAKAQGKFDQEYSSALEMIAPEVDESLQEVREVLNVMIAIADNTPGLTLYEESDVERTRALMARLTVEKGEANNVE